MHPRTFKLIFFLTIIGILGAILIALATKQEMSTNSGSLLYLSGAEQITKDGTYALENEGELQPIVYHPPLYPFVLAVLSQFGLEPLSAARILHILLFPLNIFLTGFIFYRISGGNIYWSLIISVLVLIAWPVVEVHLGVWPEPLYIFFTNAGILMLSEFFKKPKINYFLMALFCISLLPLIKYSGLVLIPIACMALLLYAPFNGQKLGMSLLFGFFSLVPIILWFTRNYLVAGNITERTSSFSLISFDQLADFSDTLSTWLLYPSIEPTYRISLFFMLLLLWLTLIFYNLRQKNVHLLYFSTKQNLFLLKSLTLFLVLYLCYLVLYISIFGKNIHINSLILAPLFIPFMAIAFHTFFLWQKFTKNSGPYKITVAILLIGFLVTNIWQGLQLFR